MLARGQRVEKGGHVTAKLTGGLSGPVNFAISVAIALLNRAPAAGIGTAQSIVSPCQLARIASAILA
jgi:hypothetical protein